MNAETAKTMFSSDRPDWKTPRWLCDEIARFFRPRGFLDPCAPYEDRLYTGATWGWNEADNGLSKGRDWTERVYLNPPYGKKIAKWVDRFCEEYEYGNMPEGIALLPARTDTKWWERLTIAGPTVCFLQGRVKFDGAGNSAPFPSVLAYLGERREPFKYSFAQYGTIWHRAY